MTDGAVMRIAASHSPPTAAGAAASPALLGLIGAPIAHSASPAMHEAAARGAGFAAHYQLIEVSGSSPETLAIILAGLRQKGFAGVNVTFPYKEMVVALLDDLSAGARGIGAVNTVVIRGGRLTGHNTDATGFALAELGAQELRIVDRDEAKAQDLAGVLAAALAKAPAGRMQARAVASPREALDGASGLVNATPAGMLPDRSSPVPAELLHQELWVADAVYSPLWTPLLLAARQCGAKVMTGRELCVYQAHDAFKLFTGAEPDAELMGAAFDEVMRSRTLQKT
jgi:shikimate dehydrogenase